MKDKKYFHAQMKKGSENYQALPFQLFVIQLQLLIKKLQ